MRKLEETTVGSKSNEGRTVASRLVDDGAGEDAEAEEWKVCMRGLDRLEMLG